MNKISDYLKLFKFRLSLTVVFSSIVGFILPNVTYNFKDLLLLIAGGSFLVFSANAFNQISEIKEDLIMLRTKKRPFSPLFSNSGAAYLI